MNCDKSGSEEFLGQISVDMIPTLYAFNFCDNKITNTAKRSSSWVLIHHKKDQEILGQALVDVKIEFNGIADFDPKSHLESADHKGSKDITPNQRKYQRIFL